MVELNPANNPQVIMVVVFKDLKVVDKQLVAVVAVDTTVVVEHQEVTEVLVVEVDLATITLDLTGQELLQVLQQLMVTLVVQVIQIILVVLVKLLLEVQILEETVQYM